MCVCARMKILQRAGEPTLVQRLWDEVVQITKAWSQYRLISCKVYTEFLFIFFFFRKLNFNAILMLITERSTMLCCWHLEKLKRAKSNSQFDNFLLNRRRLYAWVFFFSKESFLLVWHSIKSGIAESTTSNAFLFGIWRSAWIPI